MADELLTSHDTDIATRSRLSQGAPDQTDRILIAVSVGLWLAALGASVAAIVALVGLAGGHSAAASESDTPWLLYAVIGVSAAVIIGAIPLLIRARRASSEPSSTTAAAGRPSGPRTGEAPPPAPRLEPFGAPVLGRTPIPAAISRVGFPTAAVEQVWLRCTAIIAGAMGAAMTCIGAGTYLLASYDDTAAWVVLGLAGLLTVLLPVVPWFFLRQLRTVLDDFEPAPR